jgi:hypothetical protein
VCDGLCISQRPSSVAQHSLRITLGLFAQAIAQASLVTFNLHTLTYADDMLVAVRDQVDVGMPESGLCLHTHTSNAKVNRHKSDIMSLNRIDISTPSLRVRPG